MPIRADLFKHMKKSSLKSQPTETFPKQEGGPLVFYSIVTAVRDEDNAITIFEVHKNTMKGDSIPSEELFTTPQRLLFSSDQITAHLRGATYEVRYTPKVNEFYELSKGDYHSLLHSTVPQALGGLSEGIRFLIVRDLGSMARTIIKRTLDAMNLSREDLQQFQTYLERF